MPQTKRATLKSNIALTERELELIRLSAEGYNNKEVAERVKLSEHTIDSHNRTIVAKLNARNMKHAIAISVRKKLIK